MKNTQMNKNPQIQPQFYYSSSYFHGNLYAAWLFIGNLPKDFCQRIQKIYSTEYSQKIKGKGQNSSLLQAQKAKIIPPICLDIKDSFKYFDLENCYYKLLIDFQTAKQFVKIMKKNIDIDKKIAQIHVYSSQIVDIDELKKAQLKDQANTFKASKFVDISFNLLEKIDYIERNIHNFRHFEQTDDKDQIKQFEQKDQNGFKIGRKNYLPAFVNLSDQDKSFITNFRRMLYASINLTDQQERQQCRNDFIKFAKRVFNVLDNDLIQIRQKIKANKFVSAEEKEKIQKFGEIQDYSQKKKIIKFEEDDIKQILLFYGQQNFYYRLLNVMLKTCHDFSDFKQINFPFHEIFTSIKLSYSKMIGQNFYLDDKNNRQSKQPNERPEHILYRGIPFDNMHLKLNQYVQFLGFLSASKNRQIGKKYAQEYKGWLLIFRIPSRKNIAKILQLDYGFVDFEEIYLSSTSLQKSSQQKNYRKQQQVLINALNIFKVVKIIPPDLNNSFGQVHLEYGAIFQLEQKFQKRYILSQQETQVIRNYKFCKNQKKQIKDQGDFFYKAEELEQALSYRKKQYEKNKTHENQLKLMDILVKMGKTDQADQMRKEMQDIILKSDNQFLKKKQNFVNAIREASTLNQDYLASKNISQRQLQCEKERGNDFGVSQILHQIGSINFQENKIAAQNTIQKYKQSQEIMQRQIALLQKQKQNIKQKLKNLQDYSCFSLFSWFKEQPRESSQNLQKQFNRIQKQLLEKYMFLLKNLISQIQFYSKIQERKVKSEIMQKTLQIIEKCKQLTKDIQQKDQIEEIRLKVSSLSDNRQVLEASQQDMEIYIKVLKKISPASQKVADISSILAQTKSRQISKFFNQICKQYEKQIREDQAQFQIDFLQLQKKQKMKGEKIIAFNHEQHKKKMAQTYSIFQQIISILSDKPLARPKLLKAYNEHAELAYENSDLQTCLKQSNTVFYDDLGIKHSEGAKAALISGKCYYSRGQLKKAFDFIKKGLYVLKRAFVKSQTPQYEKIYEDSEIKASLDLMRIKVFLKQNKHEFALRKINANQSASKINQSIESIKSNNLSQKNIEKIEKIKQYVESQLKNIESSGYLSNIYQEVAFIYALIREQRHEQWYGYYKKAIDMRKRVRGQNNMANAICYCSVARHYIQLNKIKQAQTQLKKGIEIFSTFHYDHPNKWVPFLTKASLLNASSPKEVKNEKELKSIEISYKLVNRKLQSSHISNVSVNLQFSKILLKNGQFFKAKEILQKINGELGKDEQLSKMVVQKQSRVEQLQKWEQLRKTTVQKQSSVEQLKNIEQLEKDELRKIREQKQSKIEQLKRSNQKISIQQEVTKSLIIARQKVAALNSNLAVASSNRKGKLEPLKNPGKMPQIQGLPTTSSMQVGASIQVEGLMMKQSNNIKGSKNRYDFGNEQNGENKVEISILPNNETL